MNILWIHPTAQTMISTYNDRNDDLAKDEIPGITPWNELILCLLKEFESKSDTGRLSGLRVIWRYRIVNDITRDAMILDC